MFEKCTLVQISVLVMKIRKQYYGAMVALGAVLAGATAYWLYAVIVRGTVVSLRATVPLLLVVLAMRITHDRFCKNGYFSREQARTFYDACQAAGVGQVKLSALEECDRIYREKVSTAELGEKARRLALYERIYAEGKALREGDSH